MVSVSVISDLLDKVLNTKLQRKAKTIIMTCVQFIFTNAFILLNVAEGAKNQDASVGTGIYVMIGIAIAYVVAVALFLLIFALCNGDVMFETTKEIEEAYAKTNASPVIDGILEIPLAFRFKGPKWWVVLIFWGLFIGIGVPFVVLVLVLPDFDVHSATSVAVVAAIFELYEITSDFAEYWIYTRNPKKTEEPVDL